MGVDKLQVYSDILTEFKEEVWRIHKVIGDATPSRLVRYLIGNHDFHKIIKLSGRTQLQPFNLVGTLGQRSPVRRASPEAQTLPLPKRIYDVHFADTPTTLLLACDAGWQLSFRIHNASEFVEPSLKFDITLTGHPAELVTQEAGWAL